MRIVSLVPSQTELLYDLGLAQQIVGVTKFCVHPAHARTSAMVVGGTKNVHLDRIDSLAPDLIICNKEENTKKQIEQLMKNYQVYMSDIKTIEDGMQLILDLGELTNKEEEAASLHLQVKKEYEDSSTGGIELPSCAYFIWKNPDMVVGKDTYINDMLAYLGSENVFGHLSRYPEISHEMLIKASPALIFLSSEPFPFKNKHIQEFQSLLPNAKIHLVNGEYFSWYGSRMLKGFRYLWDLRNQLK